MQIKSVLIFLINGLFIIYVYGQTEGSSQSNHFKSAEREVY